MFCDAVNDCGELETCSTVAKALNNLINGSIFCFDRRGSDVQGGYYAGQYLTLLTSDSNDAVALNAFLADPTIPFCCDVDGNCADGDDDWCCGSSFYCSNDGEPYASERGGVVCPSDFATYNCMATTNVSSTTTSISSTTTETETESITTTQALTATTTAEEATVNEIPVG